MEQPWNIAMIDQQGLKEPLGEGHSCHLLAFAARTRGPHCQERMGDRDAK